MKDLNKTFEEILREKIEAYNKTVTQVFKFQLNDTEIKMFASAMKEAYNLRGEHDIKELAEAPRYFKFYEDLELDATGNVMFINDILEAINKNNI